MSFRFVSFRFKITENLQPCGDVCFDILITSKGASALGMFYLPFETDALCTNSENRMNGREMFRQTSAKQTNAQTKARPPNKQMVESAGRRFTQVEKAV